MLYRDRGRHCFAPPLAFRIVTSPLDWLASWSPRKATPRKDSAEQAYLPRLEGAALPPSFGHACSMCVGVESVARGHCYTVAVVVTRTRAVGCAELPPVNSFAEHLHRGGCSDPLFAKVVPTWVQGLCLRFVPPTFLPLCAVVAGVVTEVVTEVPPFGCASRLHARRGLCPGLCLRPSFRLGRWWLGL